MPVPSHDGPHFSGLVQQTCILLPSKHKQISIRHARLFASIQGLSKRFERFKFGIFYVL